MSYQYNDKNNYEVFDAEVVEPIESEQPRDYFSSTKFTCHRHKSGLKHHAWFTWYAWKSINGAFSVLCINAFLSILAINGICSLFAVNSLGSFCSLVSYRNMKLMVLFYFLNLILIPFLFNFLRTLCSLSSRRIHCFQLVALIRHLRFV